MVQSELGFVTVVVQELARQIKALKAMGLAILFAEQNMHFATEISDRAYVIEKGHIPFQSTMAELAANPRQWSSDFLKIGSTLCHAQPGSPLWRAHSS